MARELIRLEEVHRAFGPLTVLESVNLRIDEGDRIGIVGHNGAGKTTLLRTISNQDQDLGDISFAAGLRLAFLTQIRDLDENATLGEELSRRGRQFQEIEDEIALLEEKMTQPSFYEGDWQPLHVHPLIVKKVGYLMDDVLNLVLSKFLEHVLQHLLLLNVP